MAQGFFGSICLDDLFTGKVVKGNNGKHYVCLEDLTALPFNKSQKNGKVYISIGVWVNDDLDQFNNIASISLQQTQQEREEKAKKVYIGNLKYAVAPGTAKAPGVTAAPSTVEAPGAGRNNSAPGIDDLPF